MHYLKHVGNTWLLAHLFHPFLFSALFAVLGDTGYILVYIFVMSLLIGLVFSIPALLCAACILPGVLRLRLSLSIVLLIWALLLGIATLCAAYLAIETLWEWRFENEPMLYPVPALLAAVAFHRFTYLGFATGDRYTLRCLSRYRNTVGVAL